MEIVLTTKLENALKAKVQSGLYHDASEVVSEALRQSLVMDREHTWLAREAGLTLTLDSKEQFMALVRQES